MAFKMDSGRSYRVEFLGAGMLSQIGTGLGVLQKPLRELYFKFRQGGKNSKLQERIITMTPKGVRISFNTANGPQEMFYGMPSILHWDAVRFVTVKASDKKLRGAFEPLDNDHSRNKDNLFSVMDKKHSFLQQLPHPAIFTCVFRRTQGVKAIDVHAFICPSEEDSLALVRALNLVQRHYTEDEVHESSVFGYNPFDARQPEVRSPDGALSPAVSGSADQTRHAVNQAKYQPQHRVSASHADLSQGRSKESPPRDRRDAPKNRAQRPGAIPLPGYQQGQGHQNESRPACIQLTQEDINRSFQSPAQPPIATSLREVNKSNSPYEYSPHIGDESPGRSNQGHKNVGSKLSRSASAVSPLNRQRTPSPRDPVGDFYFGQDTYAKPQRKRDEQLRKGSPGGSAAPGPMGQGYGLLSGGSGHEPRPDPRRRDGSPTGYQHSIPRTKEKVSPKHEYIDFNEFSERLKLSPPGQRQSYAHPVSDRDRLASPKVSRSKSSAKYSPNLSQPSSRLPQGSSRTVFGDNSNDAPNKPVAKVPPHKVQGVKVLPTASVPLNLSQNNLKKTNSNPPSDDFQPEVKRSSSGSFDNQQLSSRPSYDAYKTPPKYSSPNDTNDSWKNSRGGSGREKEDQPSETLLARQKKDAEIASVVQDLHFDHVTNTMSPHGTNFEKSLGYFP